MTLPLKIAEKYLKPVFVETGTHKGDGIMIARQAGFKRIYSCELNYDLFLAAHPRWKHDPNVQITCGDSALFLRGLLPNLDSEVTFWLDAHNMDGPENPLLEELAMISVYQKKPCNILIDDLRVMESQWGISIAKITNTFIRMYPSCVITRENSLIADKDILAVIA